MKAERKEDKPVKPILLGRETVLGYTWTYKLIGCALEDGQVTRYISLYPETEPYLYPADAIIFEFYTGTEAEVWEWAVGAIRHWPTIRKQYQQYLGKGVVVPEEAPDPRQLEIFPPER